MRATHKIEFIPQLQLNTSINFSFIFNYFTVMFLMLVLILTLFATVYTRFLNMDMQLTIAKSASEYSNLVKHNQYLILAALKFSSSASLDNDLMSRI